MGHGRLNPAAGGASRGLLGTGGDAAGGPQPLAARALSSRTASGSPTDPPTVALLPSNALTRSQTRVFVAVLVALVLGLSVLATALITRGWGNPTVQEQVREQETERRLQMPRLDGTPPEPPEAGTPEAGAPDPTP